MTTHRHYQTDDLPGGRKRLWFLIGEKHRHPVTVNAAAVTEERIRAIGEELARVNFAPPPPPGEEPER